MNNTVENDFFGFPKVKWLQLTGEVDIQRAWELLKPRYINLHITLHLYNFHVKFSQDLTYQKSLKSVNY